MYTEEGEFGVERVLHDEDEMFNFIHEMGYEIVDSFGGILTQPKYEMYLIKSIEKKILRMKWTTYHVVARMKELGKNEWEFLVSSDFDDEIISLIRTITNLYRGKIKFYTMKKRFESISLSELTGGYSYLRESWIFYKVK